MKSSKSSIRSAAMPARINSVIWAASLLFPVLLVASKTTQRSVFHVLIFMAVWFGWTFTEYYAHRFIMHHGNQKKGPGKWLNHDHHHQQPSHMIIRHVHRMLLIMGAAILTLCCIFFDNYFTLFYGWFAGFTVYTFMHLLLHRKWSARVFPNLHKFHIDHHCRYTDKCFGVTVTWWDHLFGTVPFKHAVISDKVQRFYYRPPEVRNRESGEKSDSRDGMEKLSCKNCKNDSCIDRIRG